VRYYFRLCLVALLALTLPLSAFADVGSSKRCVKKINGVVVSMTKDCCDPVKEAQSSTKKSVCKTGQECNTFQNYPPTTMTLAPMLPVPVFIALNWQEPAISSHLLDTLWRPPRSLA